MLFMVVVVVLCLQIPNVSFAPIGIFFPTSSGFSIATGPLSSSSVSVPLGSCLLSSPGNSENLFYVFTAIEQKTESHRSVLQGKKIWFQNFSQNNYNLAKNFSFLSVLFICTKKFHH